MKKTEHNLLWCVIVIVVLLVTAFIISLVSGCGDEKEETTAELSPVKVVESEIKLSELVPDPEAYFFNTEFEYVTDDGCYMVYLDYVSEDEWNNYISKCEEAGFWTNESYRSEYSWYVNSSDDAYELMLDRYGDKNEYMTIIVNKLDGQEEEE